MGHMGPGPRERAHLVFADPDHVDEHHVGAHQSHVFGKLDREAPIRAPEELPVLPHLGEVHGDPQAVFPGEAGDLAVQVRGDRAGRAGAEPDAQAAVRRPLPPPVHLQRPAQPGLAVLDHPGVHRQRRIRVPRRIHDDLGERRADPALAHHLRDPVESIPVGEHGLEKRRRPRSEHLGDAEPGARPAVVLGEMPLQDPDAVAEPLHERPIVRAAADERLRQVNVRVDEPGDEDVVREAVDRLGRVPRHEVRGLAHLDDPIAPRRDGAVGDDPAAGIHGDHERAGHDHEMGLPGAPRRRRAAGMGNRWRAPARADALRLRACDGGPPPRTRLICPGPCRPRPGRTSSSTIGRRRSGRSRPAPARRRPDP